MSFFGIKLSAGHAWFWNKYLGLVILIFVDVVIAGHCCLVPLIYKITTIIHTFTEVEILHKYVKSNVLYVSLV